MGKVEEQPGYHLPWHDIGCCCENPSITDATIAAYIHTNKTCTGHPLLSTAERRGTPELLSASVSGKSGNSPQMAALRRSCEIDQSTQRFHVGCDNRCLLGNEYGRLHGREFLGRTLMILILTNQADFVTLSVVKIPPLAQPSLF